MQTEFISEAIPPRFISMFAPDFESAETCFRRIFLLPSDIFRKDGYAMFGDNMNTIIRTENLTKIYPGKRKTVALDGVSFSVEQGEMLAVVGASGSGKSTLMHILGCLDEPTSGHYYLGGRDVSKMSRRALTKTRAETIGFIFQDFHLVPELTALENVALPLLYRGYAYHDAKLLARRSLARVGLANRQHHKPKELSGGQEQRVAIARALVGKPPIILADEPTGNLDAVSGHEVMKLLSELNGEGHTVLMITHDVTLARTLPRRLQINAGHCE